MSAATAELDALIATWAKSPRASEHIVAEAGHALQTGQSLKPGEPVPGCRCEECSPEPEGRAVVRVGAGSGGRLGEEQVQAARAAPILEVADRLGVLGDAEEVGGAEWRLSCPLPDHEDRTPSCFLNSDDSRWYCHGCGRGGNTLDLVMQVRLLPFRAAVRWTLGLAAEPPERPERVRPRARVVDGRLVASVRAVRSLG